MDNLRQIADEFIRLYRQQLSTWVLAKMHDLSDADLAKYFRRKRRMSELRLKLEKMVAST
jgi:hypothetical protein